MRTLFRWCSLAALLLCVAGTSLAACPGAPANRFSRPEREWQGMLPDPTTVWPCMPDGTCSMARACIDGRCLPCAHDKECRAVERCVFAHCVLSDRIECRSRRDCDDPEALCLLSGYTPLDPRSNRDMHAYCRSPRGGTREFAE
ncbi:hypothetical protein [Nannocystis punicea]|uniref:Dickkopf N-terminal cysteine-rich domain-containing protein n=1 Tax=Nannocystis punicea TaxID=2995304 RepID=A0ABY7GRU7_9BACT|nr:hypothetical protein [Nannocystis poenicansa]WAS89657.1 hypothetical protein O0S08_25980 [Nannocystis poenicansa]